MGKIKLSILILSIHERVNSTYLKLINQLKNQIGNREDIEVVSLYDNMVIEVGEKRNKLLSIAQGKYLTFIDDDDRVSDDYISLLMNVIKKNKNEDCIVFDCLCILFERNMEVLCKYGIEYEYWWSEDKKHWRGKPAHTMVLKSGIVKKHRFRGAVGEDMDWVNRVIPHIKTQARINKILYYYQKGIVPKPPRKGKSKNILPIAKIIEENKRKGISYSNEVVNK